MYNPNASVQFKDLPNFTSLFGNRSNSWDNALPNDLFIKGVPKNIRKDYVKRDSTGAGPDVLDTFTIPAGTLTVNSFFDFWFGGGLATNDTDKRIDAQFDGTAFEDTGARDLDAGNWVLFGRVAAISDTSVLISSSILVSSLAVDSTAAVITTFNEGHFTSTRNKTQAVASLLANNMVIRCRGYGAAAADVFQRGSIINLTRF